ncbi:MAG TPA: TIGR04255 family protein [Gemmatimonadaceae bacterium]
MAAIRPLSHPPITEAVVDFRVALPPSFAAHSLAQSADQLRDAFPVTEEMRRFETLIDVRGGKPATTRPSEGQLVGYRFKSADGRDVAQFRVDGLTYNRLEPYTNWDTVRPKALHLWNLFVQVTGAARAERLALRYINRLSVPPEGDLTDFLEVYPPQFPGSPSFVSGFVTRISTHDPVTNFNANVAQTLELRVPAGRPSLLFDIDVYKAGGLGRTDQELGPVLDRLRAMKNDIFFGSITEVTARRYE